MGSVPDYGIAKIVPSRAGSYTQKGRIFMSRAVDIVREVAPHGKADYIAAFEHGDGLLKQHEINTPGRLAHFLAQVMHECDGLRLDWENMNYNADRLVEIFGVGKHSAAV